jgi:metal transporter CNNM
MEISVLGLEVVLLVVLSAMCSGLNVALMALDIADLRRKSKIGNPDARKVLPLRKNTHLSLAAILLTNVAAVSATSLVLESKTGGLIAGIASTLLIVIFGEIMPQALFSKHALSYVARLSSVLHFMIWVTFPISKPIQLLLDRLFGQETAQQLQSRHELGIMMTEHLGDDNSELDEDEVEIIRGALQLSEKRVRDIMMPIRSVYYLMPDTVLDDAKIDQIKERGWSRIPIFNAQQTKCYGLLLMKDLVDVDFDSEPILVSDMPLYPVQLVGSMTALDTMLRRFINGGAHLIPVEKDDEIVGIVTIEDLLEEIVGHEIEDETDRSRRNARRKKLPRLRPKKLSAAKGTRPNRPAAE